MPYYMYNLDYLIYMLPFIALAAWAQFKVKSTYNKYSSIKNDTNLSGAEVARIILDRNNLQHVQIRQVNGVLSDHYDPRTQVVSLSPGVYQSTSIAAAGVAAHEVGHAMQHAKGYVPLKIRSAIAPVVSLTSNFVWLMIAIGFMFQSNSLIQIGVMFFAGTVLFQLVTLPVEFNASSRAIKQLQNGLIGPSEVSGAKSVLNAAALTYVAATLTAIAQLARLLSMSNSRNND